VSEICCPRCGFRLQGDEPAVDPVETLRAWCREHGHHITADGCVYEDTAAALLDRAPATLKNWRCAGAGLLPFRRHGRSGRVRYRLVDLAELLERGGD
jgi:hypothetical protein